MGSGEFNAGGVETLLVASCYRNRDKLGRDGTLGLRSIHLPSPCAGFYKAFMVN